MNRLINLAISSNNKSIEKERAQTRSRAKLRIQECFGEDFEDSLEEISNSEFKFKGTNWRLVYGFGDGFTLWHDDAISKKIPEKYCAWQILDLPSLGNSIKALTKTWGEFK